MDSILFVCQNLTFQQQLEKLNCLEKSGYRNVLEVYTVSLTNPQVEFPLCIGNQEDDIDEK